MLSQLPGGMGIEATVSHALQLEQPEKHDTASERVAVAEERSHDKVRAALHCQSCGVCVGGGGRGGTVLVLAVLERVLQRQVALILKVCLNQQGWAVLTTRRMLELCCRQSYWQLCLRLSCVVGRELDSCTFTSLVPLLARPESCACTRVHSRPRCDT